MELQLFHHQLSHQLLFQAHTTLHTLHELLLLQLYPVVMLLLAMVTQPGHQHTHGTRNKLLA